MRGGQGKPIVYRGGCILKMIKNDEKMKEKVTKIEVFC